MLFRSGSFPCRVRHRDRGSQTQRCRLVHGVGLGDPTRWGTRPSQQTVTVLADVVLKDLGSQAANSGGSTTITLPQISQLSQALSKTQTISIQAAVLLKDLQILTQSLSVQQAQLQAGVSTLNNGVNQLAPNATAALNGYNSVRSANNQLLAGSTSLTNGLAQAQTGSQQLANGARLLDSRSSILTNGTSQLAGGADTLATKLTDAYYEIGRASCRERV